MAWAKQRMKSIQASKSFLTMGIVLNFASRIDIMVLFALAESMVKRPIYKYIEGKELKIASELTLDKTPALSSTKNSVSARFAPEAEL